MGGELSHYVFNNKAVNGAHRGEAHRGEDRFLFDAEK